MTTMKLTPVLLTSGLIALCGLTLLLFRASGLGWDGSSRASDRADPSFGSADELKLPTQAQALDRRTEDALGAGFWSAPVGSEFVYEISAQTSARIELAQDAEVLEQTLEQRLAGQMRVLVVARKEDKVMTQVSFPQMRIDATVGAQSGRDTVTEEAVAQPTLVRMQSDGHIEGFRFHADAPPEARGWIRSQVSSFRFEVERSDASTWEREEQDPTGMARVRYERELGAVAGEFELRKTKVDYAPLSRGAGGAAVEVTPQVHALTTGVLSESIGWLREAQVDERLVMPVAGLGVEARMSMSATLRLQTQRRIAADELPTVDWDGEWDSVSGAEDLELLSTRGESLLRAKLLEGLTLDGLLAQIDELCAANPRDTAALMDARHQLAEFLIDNEAAIEALAQRISTLRAASADIVLGALGSAGSESAQRVLASVLADSSLSGVVRQSSLDAMFQLTRPSAAACDGVERLIADRAQDSGLRANGLLVLGALASMDSADGSERVTRLLALELSLRDEGRLEHWLHALGNSGDARALEASAPYRSDADPRLRAAAAEALRGIHTAESSEALGRLARLDQNTSVRRTSAALLAGRADATSVQLVRELLAREAAVEVRRAAVDALGRRASSDAEARALLKSVAGNDSSKELRQRANDCLQ
jgi:HEAT repeat protein